MEYLNDPTINISSELIEIGQLTLENVLEYAVEKTSGWILEVIDDFSDDYAVFRDNWGDTCSRIAAHAKHDCSPQKILLVDAVFFQQTGREEVFFQNLCSKLTEYGYCVRRKTELTRCTVCGAAMPVEQLYHRMIASKNPISLQLPLEYSDVCVGCKD